MSRVAEEAIIDAEGGAAVSASAPSDIAADVLIVGGGPAGLTASMLLSQLGVDSLLVNARPVTTRLPKASLLNQRTMEIFSDLGVAKLVYSRATPPENMRYTAWYAGLHGSTEDHGREIGRAALWGAGGQSADWIAASPCLSTNLPQDRLEPILKARAEELAPGRVRFCHELMALSQDRDSVTSLVANGGGGERYRVRSRYLLSCDGGRTVGGLLGIPLDGPRNLVRMVSVHLSADLSAWARDPDVLIRWLWLPGRGVGAALVPTGPQRWGPDSEDWTFHFSYSNDDPRAVDDRAVVSDMRTVLGLPDLDIDVRMISRWSVEGLVARTFRKGRVFLLGDAAHRHPPTGALGLNSAVQDAHNLAWKLAATLRGHASDRLLDTYEAERRPTTSRYVQRSLEYAINHFTTDQEFVDPTGDPDAPWRLLRQVWSGAEADSDRRSAVQRALAVMSVEFDHHNIEYGYTYNSSAIVEDGSPVPTTVDPIRVYQPCTRPGHPLPHAWLGPGVFGRLSTLHLVQPGRFLLITGENGHAWCEAAARLATEGAVPVDAVRIGSADGDYVDLRSSWQRCSGITSRGAVLVRPDRFICWRSIGAAADPVAELSHAIETILGRTGDRLLPTYRIGEPTHRAIPRRSQRPTTVEVVARTWRALVTAARRRGAGVPRRIADGRTDAELEHLLRLPFGQRVLFEAMARSFRPSKAYGFAGKIQITLSFPATGGADEVWTVNVGKDRASVRRGASDAPVVAIRATAARFLQLACGCEPSAVLLRDDGTFSIHGELGIALRLSDMFGAGSPPDF